MVSHTSNPSYVGGIGRRFTVQGQPCAKGRHYQKNKLKQKELAACLK
jgi:hypothetical protein